MTIKSKITEKTLQDLEKMSGIKLTLGKLLWAIRQADETPQVKFADQLGITKQHLCDIERERKSVSPQLAAKYAEILGYSQEQFIRLSLQDLVDRAGLNIQVDIMARKPKKRLTRPKAKKIAA
jgi:transcriptional regulator with XRE-family HTH domain